MHLLQLLVHLLRAGVGAVEVAHGLQQHRQHDRALEVEVGPTVDGVGVPARGAHQLVEPCLLARLELGAEGGVALLEGLEGVGHRRRGLAHGFGDGRTSLLWLGASGVKVLRTGPGPTCRDDPQP